MDGIVQHRFFLIWSVNYWNWKNMQGRIRSPWAFIYTSDPQYLPNNIWTAQNKIRILFFFPKSPAKQSPNLIFLPPIVLGSGGDKWGSWQAPGTPPLPCKHIPALKSICEYVTLSALKHGVSVFLRLSLTLHFLKWIYCL